MANIYNLFKFIESKRPEYRTPLKFKLLLDPETITPEELHVSGNLNLSRTSIKSLPAGLRVDGSLYLAYTQIKSLPAGLRVGGNLVLSGTPIQTLPTGLRVDGSLYLSQTKIQSLPADLQVDGDLSLSGTPIAEKHSAEEILKMIEDTGGSVKGIYT